MTTPRYGDLPRRAHGLAACLDAQGVALRPGDILLVRTRGLARGLPARRRTRRCGTR
jgi:hypothetical protein